VASAQDREGSVEAYVARYSAWGWLPNKRLNIGV
jgi:hypothetical protein